MPFSQSLKKVYSILESNGYEDRGGQEVSGRRLFVKGSEENMTNYLHVARERSVFWKDHLFFCDYLRQHKNTREEYNNLKKQLVTEFGTNRAKYTKAKDVFIRKILDIAK